MRFFGASISVDGIAEISAFVYGCNGFRKSSFEGLVSTSCPKYITLISWDM
jgi:hypothetical protein